MGVVAFAESLLVIPKVYNMYIIKLDSHWKLWLWCTGGDLGPYPLVKGNKYPSRCKHS